MRFNHIHNHAFIGVLYTQESFWFNNKEMLYGVRLYLIVYLHRFSSRYINECNISVTEILFDLMKILQQRMMRKSSCMLWVFGYFVVSLHGFSHSGIGVERFMRINDENAISYPSTNVNHCLGLFLIFCKTVSKSINQNDFIFWVTFRSLKRCYF